MKKSTITKIMLEVNSWESTDKSALLEEILSTYCNDVVVESVHYDIVTRQKDNIDKQ